MSSDARAEYREIIDALVHSCRAGQGQLARRRAQAGLWNQNADDRPDELPDQHAFNVLLRKLDAAEREVLGALLAQQFVSGVHEALVVLHARNVPPLGDAYEGTPYHDFVGRLGGWEWPIGR